MLTQNSLLEIDLAQHLSGLKQKTALFIYNHYELYLQINIRYKYWVSPEYKQSQTEKRKGSNCGRSRDYNLLENIYADCSSQILCIQSDRALEDLKGKRRKKTPQLHSPCAKQNVSVQVVEDEFKSLKVLIPHCKNNYINSNRS